jgi:site-specific DNA-methyltransferase (adenine-specific)
VPADAAPEPGVLPVARAPGRAAHRRRGCLTAADPLAALVARATAPQPGDAGALPHVLAHADAGDLLAHVPTATIDLVYVDPPFGTGVARAGREGAGYADALPSGIDGHVAWLRELLAACHRALRPSGSLFLHLDWRASHRARVVLDELFGEASFRNEIIWRYGLGGGAPRDAFARKHDTILFYARSGEATFHAERGPVTAAMEAKYAHVDELGRRYQNAHGRRYYLRGGKRLDDVWDMPAIAPTARERVGWPTQKPLALLQRIVRAASNPGDCVLDPCCGSGTALVAAASLGRRAIGGDQAREAVDLTAARLAALTAAPQLRPITRVKDLDERVLP